MGARLLRLARLARRLGPGLVAAGLLSATGCASFSTHLTPRPTPVGELEVHANVDVQAYQKDSGEHVQLPAIEAAVRYGVAPGIDLGGRVGPVHAELDSRLGLIRTDDFELTIAPGVGLVSATRATGHSMAIIGALSLPVLAAFHLDRDLSLVTGVKILAHLGRQQVELADGSGKTQLGDAEVALYPGALVGLELILSETFSLVPELNLLFPYLPTYDKLARPVWQGGISFQFHIPS